ncbi:MAG: leucine-rich repeat protein [Clostridia bacterium]|nr:leucine-rich repeat protein [Clostridia bacterium]
MKKRLAFVAILLLVLVITIACGSQDNNKIAAPVENVTAFERINEIIDLSSFNTNEGLTEDELFGIYNAEISVIVTVSDKSLVDLYLQNGKSGSVAEFMLSKEALKLKEEWLAAQDSVMREMTDLQIEFEHTGSFTTLFNGFTANVRYCDIAAIENAAGVERVVICPEYEINSTSSEEDFVGAFSDTTGILTNESEYKGDGMLVAVIDNALDYNHTAFANFEGVASVKLEYIESLKNAFYGNVVKGANYFGASDFYISEKIPFAFDYAQKDADVMPTANSVTRFGAYHGTHVAGILTGKDDVICGVVPNAQLAFMKVGSDYGTSITAESVFSALDDCILLGVDAINMSFGSGAGFTYERGTDSDYINGLYTKVQKLGIGMCLSAGNSADTSSLNTDLGVKTYNPDSGVVSSPSTYTGTLSVASFDTFPYYFLAVGEKNVLFNNAYNANQQAYGFAEGLFDEEGKFSAEIVFAGLGRETDYVSDVDGKVVLVMRGEISFAQKQSIAAQKGAVACIICNNEDVMINAQIPELTIPTCTIKLGDGEYIRSQIEKGVASIALDKDNKTYFLSSFSSWGPTGDLKIKPEITSAGGYILSSVPSVLGASYAYLSGTSMASPNTAGVYTAVTQYLKGIYPEYSKVQIQSLAWHLLMSTATPIKAVNDCYASPRRQGSGVVSLEKCLDSKAYLSVSGSIKPKLELGDDKNKDGVYTLRFAVVNFGTESLSWALEVITQTAEVDVDGVNVTGEPYALTDATVAVRVTNGIYNDGVLTVEGGSQADLVVTIRLTDEEKLYLDENFENGMYVEGFAMLHAVDGVDLSIPWLSFYGDWCAAPIFDASIYDGEVADTLGTTLYGYIPQSEYYYPMGSYSYYVLPEGFEQPAATTDKIAISRNPNMQSYVALYSVGMALLRNAKELTYTVTDSLTGYVYWEGIANNVKKAYDNEGSLIYTMHTLFQFLWISNYTWANNQEFTITVAASIDYPDSKPQSISFPFVIDFEAPTLIDAQISVENERTYLDLEMYDNRYLSNILLHTRDFQQAVVNLYDYALPIYDARCGVNNTVRFDISDYLANLNDNKDLIISIQDYSLNLSTYDMGSIAERLATAQGVVTDGIKTQMLQNDFDDDMSVAFAYRLNSDVFDTLNVTGTYSEEGKHYFEVNQAGELVKYEGDGGVVVIPDNLGIKTIAGTPEVFAYRQDITGIVIPEGVTTLAQQCFIYCMNLETATLPSTITTMGNSVFERCVALKSIAIPEGVTQLGNFAFNFCQNLEEVSLPNSLNKLGNYAFAYCHKLTEFDFAATSINNIGSQAFMYATGIKEITLPANGKTWTIGAYAFSYMLGLEKLTVNANVGNLSNSFIYLMNLKEAKFYGSVGALNGNMFQFSTSLEVLEFYGNVGSLGTNSDYATGFSHMPLKKIEFFGTVNSIPASYFSYCYNLEEVIFHKSVTSISGYAFPQCPKLTKFTVAEDNTSMVFDKDTNIMYNAAKTRMYIPQAWDYKGTFVMPDTITTLEIAQFGVSKVTDNKLKWQEFEARTDVVNVNMPYEVSFLYPACAFYIEEGDSALTKSIEGITLSSKVTAIPNYLFRNLSSLTQVNLGGNTKTLGQYVFTECTALKGIELPTTITSMGNYVFIGCKGLETITIPDSVKIIPIGAFSDCATLKSVTLGSALTTVNTNSFQNCTSLEEVNMPETVVTIGYSAFNNCTSLKKVHISDKVKIVSGFAFYNCISLQEVNIPVSATQIADSAFSYTAIKEIAIPSGLTKLNPVYAFFGCYEIENITVDEKNTAFAAVDGVLFDKSVETLYLYPAAKDCSDYVIPETVTTVGDYAFYNASKVDNVSLSNVESIYTYAFYGSSVKNVILNDRLSFVDTYAYGNMDIDLVYIANGTCAFDYSCVFYESSIKRIEVAEGNTSFVFENYMLYNTDKTVLYTCSSELTGKEIVIGEGIVKIAASAFINNKCIERIVLPSTLVAIGDKAFFGCTSLKYIEFKSEEAPALEGNYTESRYPYQNFVTQIENVGEGLDIEVVCGSDKSYHSYIWSLYFKTL